MLYDKKMYSLKDKILEEAEKELKEAEKELKGEVVESSKKSTKSKSNKRRK